ncbi:MAG: glycine C-acetyltransferase [Spirochaetaceae bacterium]|nr:MAG: glycine C-acetyltransferase [Spirochaetaceae bacterium]
MFSQEMQEELRASLQEIESQGLMKNERVLSTPQGAKIRTLKTDGTMHTSINFCANNYLGLADSTEIIQAASDTMRARGYGLSSVRFICGTQDIHKELEAQVSEFLGTDDTILYAACFDANGGVFEPLLGAEDAIISDALNHASIIDGVRLCKATRFRYEHSDMEDLERCLLETPDARYRLICTDGVFSMDGDIAKLPEICKLAEQYNALVMVDECHATGVLGATGRGTAEHFGLEGRVDIITTTFGKALGGASGGCVSGRREIIALLRQRSRPYLFSNTLAPAVAGGTLKALELLSGSSKLIGRLHENTRYFKEQMKAAGFEIPDTASAIVPVMLYDEKLALKAADMLLEEGIYVIGFAYPVVPKGKARIRVQLSAAHTHDQLDHAVSAFSQVGRELGVIQ